MGRERKAQTHRARRPGAGRSPRRAVRTHKGGKAQPSVADLRTLTLRTSELKEPLRQQAAPSRMLRVISSSPGELESALQAALESATRICEAKFGTLFRVRGGCPGSVFSFTLSIKVEQQAGQP